MSTNGRIDGFERFDIAEGVRLWVLPDKRFKTVWIRAFVHRPLDALATHTALLPAILRRGCRRQDTMSKIAAFLESLYGASYGADVHKMGERHIISFHMDVINDRFVPGRTLHESISFLARIMTQPVKQGKGFRKEYIASEKQNQKRLIEGLLNDRGSYAYERCVSEMCEHEAYSRYEYGEIEDLPSIDAVSLASFHAKTFSTAPIEFFVAGDVAPAKVARMINSAFSFGKRKVNILPDVELRPAPVKPREIIEKMDVEQAHIVIGARTGLTWRDETIFQLSFANAVLGGFPHSKLFRNVRERDGLAYGVGSSIDPAKGLLFINAGIDFAKYAKALSTIREQLEAVQQGDISDEEMEKTRASLLNRTRSREDNLPARISFFHELNAYGRPWSSDEILDRYASVTRDQIVSAAARIKLDTIYFLTKQDG